MTLCVVSCDSKTNVPSTSKIKALMNTYLAENQEDVMIVTLRTGYFECNDSEEINYYKKLEKLGIVKCDVQNFQWYTRVTKKIWHKDYVTNYYYEGTDEHAYTKPHYTDGPVVTEYIPNYHNMINVQLTKKGQGMVFQEKEEKEADDSPIYDPKDFPMDDAELFTPVEMKEAPALPEPEIIKEYIADKRKPAVQKENKETPAPAAKEETPKKAVVRYPLRECMDPATAEAYAAAKQSEAFDDVNIVVAEMKVVEVKDRVIRKEGDEVASMEATAILKTAGVTEASHLIYLHNYSENLLNNQKTEETVRLVNNWVAGMIDKEEWSIEE